MQTTGSSLACGALRNDKILGQKAASKTKVKVKGNGQECPFYTSRGGSLELRRCMQTTGSSLACGVLRNDKGLKTKRAAE
jgi:hypothetical protein